MATDVDHGHHPRPRVTCRPTRPTTGRGRFSRGPCLLFLFFGLWGFWRNMPPFPASATPDEVWQHYRTSGCRLLIGMSVCLTMTAFYMSWSVAVARVMERIEGPGGVLSKLEMMGGTITCAPVMLACAIWLTAAHEVNNLDPGIMHMLYWFGWLLFDWRTSSRHSRSPHQHRVHA